MLRPLFVLLLLTSFATAVDPPKVGPFPDIPTVPLIPTPTDPNAIPNLTKGTVYVVKEDVAFTLRASPKGLVNLTKSGPVTAYGKFIDGNGDDELRIFPQKNVYLVTPIKGAVGKVELIYSPVGAVDDSTDVTRMVNVNNAPQPPPKPDDPPAPKPVDPTVPVVVKTFRVIFVHESGGTLPLGQTPVSDAKPVRDWLLENTTPDGQWWGARKYDKDQEATDETPGMKAMWIAAKPQLTTIPSIAILVNDKVFIENYPKNATDALALLKSYKEGKVK